ncbi:serine hydrolase [Novosphingobium sp.]|jgi:CubicO group peptidase (beta-lactamase class C family)|uniref:serine hydrolase domain-containing protein n=1 Tax=Novosphingobium sp. TaxID=1874826 RepID=UPI001ECA2EBD|nr:serine hydrolase [Novosphingobium sp.]MBK6800898.1 serine hydrolase [Novosphingobium sp.]MBK9011456.1 serine hydrolase [Novosphingobium sp.]
MAGPLLDAHSSDPALMGWMEGLPPPPDKRLAWARADHMRFPTHRHAFSHMREFLPTARVSRGQGAVWELPVALRDDLDGVRFATLDDGRDLTWEQALAANFTDGVVVLHRGTIVYERYLGVTRRDTPHIAFSVTKSFVGTIAEMLVAEGRLDPAAPVADLIPELAGSGFADATLRQVMDMTTALDFSEEYTDPASGIGAFSMALGLTPRPPGYSGPGDVYAFLPTIRKNGDHGERFTYRTCNTEVLGWIVARIEGERLDRVLARRIWQPLGMEQDADFLLDGTGMPFAGGGLNPVLRDMARFGEAIRCGGQGGGGQAIATAVVESIRAGGSRAAFAPANYVYLPDCSYRSQWWMMPGNHGAFSARGIHGQAIYVDPAAELVIARFGSHPVAASSGNDPTSLPAYRALAEHLMRG